jgi:hypothetical protein
LEDLSLDSSPAAEPSAAQGLLGISEDGSVAYFASKAVLTGGATNSFGSSAQPGEANLYLWKAGTGLRFIGTLGADDLGDWSTALTEQTARVSPDGDYLTFMSRRSLTGYDNHVEGDVKCEEESRHESPDLCSEVYLYSATTNEVSCVSCNPSGARPTGRSALPTWSSAFQQPRYLSDDGSRVFFESYDSLTPADTNGRLDVYEFERPGSGSCTVATASPSLEADGCVYLLSSGKSSDDSHLLDASADGTNVFISTRSQLVGWDKDERFDIYDSRVGGGFPEPSPSPLPCEGEVCKGPGQGAPSGARPGTVNFVGAGNQAHDRAGRGCAALHRAAKRTTARAKRSARRLHQTQQQGRRGSSKSAARLRHRLGRLRHRAETLKKRARACQSGGTKRSGDGAKSGDDVKKEVRR